MEASGQLYTLADIWWGKNPEYLLNRTLGGPQSLSEHFILRGENYLAGNGTLDYPAYPNRYTD